MPRKLTNKIVAYILIGSILVFVAASTFLPEVDVSTDQLIILSGIVTTLLYAREAAEEDGVEEE